MVTPEWLCGSYQRYLCQKTLCSLKYCRPGKLYDLKEQIDSLVCSDSHPKSNTAIVGEAYLLAYRNRLVLFLGEIDFLYPEIYDF